MSEPKQNLPDWLRETQNNSWVPEIFISGVVLFGLFQIPEHLEAFRYFVSREVYDSTSDIDLKNFYYRKYDIIEFYKE